MTEDDIAHTYDDVTLQRCIEGNQEERNFWFKLLTRFPETESTAYYGFMFQKFDDRVQCLMNLQRDKFGE